jgi:hypothetical protein
MANTFAPFGFSQNRGNGSAPTYEQRVRKIASGNATAIYAGDPVTTLNTGYITQSSPGTTQIAGIFVGCKYLSTALQRTIWSPFWPGSGATGDVEAYIVNDPNAQFVAQVGGSTSTGIVFADIGANVNFAVGTGSTVTGISGAYVDQTTVNTTATLPFRIVSLIENPPGGPGTDSTSAYNWVLVAFNNVDTKSLTGI